MHGSAYEGDVTVLNCGALQLNLKGYDGDRVVPNVVRVDFVTNETHRKRIWSGNAAARILLIDVDNTRMGPKKD